MSNKLSVSLLAISFFLHLSPVEAMEPQEEAIVHKQIQFRQAENSEEPNSRIDLYYNSVAPENHQGTLVYFHGGPNQETSFLQMKAVILPCLNRINYRFVSVEISGSSAISEQIDDKGEKPNYVTQIEEIMAHLKGDKS